jgi:hypothetical protein
VLFWAIGRAYAISLKVLDKYASSCCLVSGGRNNVMFARQKHWLSGTKGSTQTYAFLYYDLDPRNNKHLAEVRPPCGQRRASYGRVTG